ncbi:permease prefix domain 1-containing protein [Papillibacter cinnamivorans]|uniref:Uncharacterized protein n=1 Tax=Papillibacter cinnamivorans DSM 12816 TaxID=1122930 RepID=A0A1W2CUI5_9FIRM|nr:permease prefix domain 1-containing protein [Papillibacter cinnamivorans]SMC88890.1 hypothetical protein SAMN02745168_0243 [Papillibacter cinnamivorans DSM 12816]
MKDKLRAYIDSLFSDAPKTRKAYELREELLSNLNAKYDDLISRGYSEEEAYQAAVAGIGDVSELIAALGGGDVFGGPDERQRKKSAMMVALAVMLYIVAIVPVILFHNLAGVVSLFVIGAAATGILVYNAMTQPRYYRADETLVEEFKEWKSANNDRIRLQKNISAALWPLIVVCYFFISFIYTAWAWSWIIFILGAAIDKIIKLVLELKE